MINSNSRVFLLLIIACCLISGLGLSFAGQKGDEVLARMLEGNKRFVSGKLAPVNGGFARLKELSKGALPSAILVTCSDAAVSPETLFDQEPGDIFTVRTGGNVLDAISVGSIEFAAGQLHAPLLLILGHDRCGIISAAVDAKNKSEDNVWIMLRKILPAVKKTSAPGSTREDIIKNTVKENVLIQQKYLLRKSPMLRGMAASGSLKLATGVYHDDNGTVEIFGN